MRTGWAALVAVRAAWACLRQHRWRSLATLTVCGLGTAGVLIASLLHRAEMVEVRARMRNLGGGLVVVSPNKLPAFPGRPRQLEHFISLDPEDAAVLAAQLPHLEAAVPVVARSTTARLGPQATRIRLIGTTPDYLRVRGFTLAWGRFLATADGSERVIVLGHAVSHELLPDGVRPGQEVYLGTVPYTVAGILQPHGVNFAGEDEDYQAFIPLETYRRRIANRPWLHHLYLQFASESDTARTVPRIQGLLREQHGRWQDQVEDVVVRDVADLTARQSELLGTVTWAVSVTSGLLLLLGAVGIATLMVLVVRERRTEIGLRRALGATPLDVGLQFFLEGIALAAAGLLAGLGLGAGAGVVLIHVMAVPGQLDWPLVLFSALVSLVAGAAACAFPAVLAARLEPGAILRAQGG